MAWALMGKRGGTKDDYGVLACGPSSGGGIPTGLHARVWAGVPSTPQLGSAPGPGRLPWATFIPRFAGGQYRMATTAIDVTEDRDSVGRPIAAIRYVELPFTGLARDHVGYRALHQAIPTVLEMDGYDQAEPYDLNLPGPDDTIADALADQRCFDRAARLAAMLLDDDVVITLSGQELLPLPDRLAEFDRTLALLPFGMRAGITVASWHDGTQATAFRLAFGKFGPRGQVTPDPDEPVPPPVTGRAAAYLRELVAARDGLGVAELVAHLGRHRRPLGLGDDEVTEATEILCSLRDPRLVVDAVRNGRPSIEWVANARRFSAGRLGQPDLDTLETHLLARGETAALAVHANWSPRSATLAARLALGELMAGRGSEVERLYRYAADRRAAEAFLAAATEGRTHQDADVPPREVARLLRTFGRPKPGDLSSLRRAVLARPELARWLLRPPTAADQDPQVWLGWLDPSAAGAPDWLRPYSVLQTQPDGLLPLPAESATDDNGADLVLIASFAVRAGSFARLAAPWWPFLLGLVRDRLTPAQPDTAAPDPSRTDFEDLLTAPVEPPGDLPTVVRLDTLRLYLDVRSSLYPLDGGEPACRGYLDALWDLWSKPPVAADVPALTVQLLGTLLPGPNPLSEAAVTLLRAVVADDRIPLSEPIADAIAEVILFAPELADDPRLTAPWWARVERLRPGLRTPSTRLRAAVRNPEADPVDIIVLCGRSAASGVPAEELARIAGPWLTRHPPEVRGWMFHMLEGQLGLAGAARNHPYDEYLLTLASLLAIPGDQPPSGPRRRARRPAP